MRDHEINGLNNSLRNANFQLRCQAANHQAILDKYNACVAASVEQDKEIQSLKQVLDEKNQTLESLHLEQVADLERTITNLKQELSDVLVEREKKSHQETIESNNSLSNEVKRLQSLLSTILSDDKIDVVSVHALSDVYKLYKAKSSLLDELQADKNEAKSSEHYDLAQKVSLNFPNLV